MQKKEFTNPACQQREKYTSAALIYSLLLSILQGIILKSRLLSKSLPGWFMPSNIVNPSGEKLYTLRGRYLFVSTCTGT
jgi:hypothetical protein